MLRTRPLIGLSLLGLLAVVGCGTSTDQQQAQGDGELIGGSRASARFAAVGALTEAGGAGGAGATFCTATLVAPSLIITARHCIEGGSEEAPEDRPADSVEFRIGSTANASGQPKAKLRRWLPVPRERDITLAELASPISGVAPIAVSLEQPLNETDLGKSFVSVGFGVRRRDGTGDVSGQRRQGTFKAECVRGNAFEQRFGSKAKFEESLQRLDPSGVADGITDRLYELGNLEEHYEALARTEGTETCFGDSGGPLVRDDGTKLELVGIVNRGFPGHASLCLNLGTVFATFGPETARFVRGELVRAR